MNKALSSTALVALVGFLGFIKPQAVAAQLADASATTLGLSGNNTATVRGFGAISVNPAGLAMSGFWFQSGALSDSNSLWPGSHPACGPKGCAEDHDSGSNQGGLACSCDH